MLLINFILDVAGLLLWLSWRTVRFDPLGRATPATLVGTVRRAEPARMRRWHFLAVLFGLLFVRALFYWQIGPAVNWTPRLDLGVVALAFRGNRFLPAFLFSLFSFLEMLLVFYFWLLALAVLHGRSANPGPFQKLIALQLGRIARWPRVVQVLLPLVFVAGLWIAAHPLLLYGGAVNRVRSFAHLIEQAALVGIGIYFTLKILLPVFLFLHVVASYVYLGSSPFWEFISATARKVLVPLNRLPLRYSRIDFAPLVGIVLILLVLHTLPTLVLNQLDRNNLTLWPQ